ncbi:hypothetical protein V2J09_020056 [Rumex salicifolius]
MGAYKAPGIDGFQPVFYQKCWNVVRESVCTFIRDFFSSGCLPPDANETLIHLIGNVDSPEGIRWNVGDGSKIRFWLDHWLDGGPLINLVVSMPPVDMLSARICDFWELDGGWVWGQFSNYLPASCLMRLCAVVIRRGPNFADSIGWAHSRDGEYSTKSAYLSLKPLPSMETELCDIFRRIWRLRVSERIRMFLWIGVMGN